MSSWRSLKRCYCGADWIGHDGFDGCTLRLAEASVLLETGLVRLRIRLDHFIDRGQRSTVWQGVVFVINVVEVRWKVFRRAPGHRGCSRCRAPLLALALETRFGCAVVDVATFPGKARFRRFSSCPLDPVIGKFRAWRRSLSTSLDNAERSCSPGLDARLEWEMVRRGRAIFKILQEYYTER